jgi:hypothetical protein
MVQSDAAGAANTCWHCYKAWALELRMWNIGDANFHSHLALCLFWQMRSSPTPVSTRPPGKIGGMFLVREREKIVRYGGVIGVQPRGMRSGENDIHQID